MARQLELGGGWRYCDYEPHIFIVERAGSGKIMSDKGTSYLCGRGGIVNGIIILSLPSLMSSVITRVEECQETQQNT